MATHWCFERYQICLHLLTAKLMSSVGISLLWEILCDMRHYLPFCWESLTRNGYSQLKTASKLSYFSSLVDTVFLTLSQTGELRTCGSCIGSRMANLKKKGWMLTTEAKSKILWKKIKKSLFCDKGSQVCCCGSSWCVSFRCSRSFSCRGLSHLVWVPHRFRAWFESTVNS